MEKATEGERSIEFNFVYSQCAISVNKFLDRVQKMAECINYIEVLNKLTRNDYMQEEPSDEVIASYLIKQINTVMAKKELSLVYYVLSNKDRGTIESITNYITQATHRPVNYSIYIIDGEHGELAELKKINYSNNASS